MLLFSVNIVCKYFSPFPIVFIHSNSKPTNISRQSRQDACTVHYKEYDSREIALLAGGKASGFQVINLTSLISVKTVEEEFLPPPYSFCPTLICRMILPIQALDLNASANRIISFTDTVD